MTTDKQTQKADEQSLPTDEVEDSYIYTSVRYDPIFKQSPENAAGSFNTPCPFYLLEHHWTRMQVANWCTQFHNGGRRTSSGPGKPTEFLQGLLHAVKQWQQAHPKEAEWAESLRIRRRAYASGKTTTEIWQVPRKPLTCFFPSNFDLPKDASEVEWTVVLDAEPTEANESTMYKTSDRSSQGRARAAAGIYSLSTFKEVLLYGSNGDIIDGSNSTPYFFRGGRWITPISSSGGLQGTTRRWSLEQGLCVEGVVGMDSLKPGEILWFSNAVKGYFRARYVLRDDEPCHPSVGQCQHVIQSLR